MLYLNLVIFGVGGRACLGDGVGQGLGSGVQRNQNVVDHLPGELAPLPPHFGSATVGHGLAGESWIDEESSGTIQYYSSYGRYVL